MENANHQNQINSDAKHFQFWYPNQDNDTDNEYLCTPNQMFPNILPIHGHSLGRF